MTRRNICSLTHTHSTYIRISRVDGTNGVLIAVGDQQLGEEYNLRLGC